MNRDLKDVYLQWICSLKSPATIHRYKVALDRFSRSIWQRKAHEVENSGMGFYNSTHRLRELPRANEKYRCKAGND